MKKNERLQALNIVTTLLRDKIPLMQLLSGEEISPLTKEICFGFCRHYFRLEAIADCLVSKRPKSLEVWNALLIGLYQLHYLSIPDYAVVKETVALLEKIKKGWAKGLVNAVLRNYCREQKEIIAKLAQQPAFLYGHPPELLQQFKKDWPNDWQQIALANDAHPPMTLRVNRLKNSVSDYLNRLKNAGIEAFAHPVAPDGITLATPCDVFSLPGFKEGCVSIQDAAAQLAASLLSLKPGQRVLDACCAPGGKTCHILETEPNLKECVALDVDKKRLERVKENLKRLHLDAKVMQGDACFPEQWWDGQLFDRILLDAPCSALGVIRRHSDIKLLRTLDEITAVTKTQQLILHSLWPLLKPGGIMVYATCSVNAIENEQQIAAFCAQNNAKVLNAQQTWGRATGHGQQILPGEQGMDGFFYSVLLKDEK